MEGKQAELLRYEKLRTVFLGAILVVMLALLIGAAVLAVGLRQYCVQISNIVDRMETVSAQLEELDVEKLVKTANSITDAVDAAQIEEIVTALNEISRELSEVDWNSLAGDLSEVAKSAQATLSTAQKSLKDFSELDIEALNKAISDLQDAVEPLAKFAKLFE